MMFTLLTGGGISEPLAEVDGLANIDLVDTGSGSFCLPKMSISASLATLGTDCFTLAVGSLAVAEVVAIIFAFASLKNRNTVGAWKPKSENQILSHYQMFWKVRFEINAFIASFFC